MMTDTLTIVADTGEPGLGQIITGPFYDDLASLLAVQGDNLVHLINPDAIPNEDKEIGTGWKKKSFNDLASRTRFFWTGDGIAKSAASTAFPGHVVFRYRTKNCDLRSRPGTVPESFAVIIAAGPPSGAEGAGQVLYATYDEKHNRFYGQGFLTRTGGSIRIDLHVRVQNLESLETLTATVPDDGKPHLYAFRQVYDSRLQQSTLEIYRDDGGKPLAIKTVSGRPEMTTTAQWWIGSYFADTSRTFIGELFIMTILNESKDLKARTKLADMMTLLWRHIRA